MRRVVVPELLDGDAGTPHQVRTSLDDLQRINTLFGGVTSTAKMVRHVSRETGAKKLSLLEVASGSGFVPKAANEWLASDGIQLEISLLDRARTHLPNNGVPTYVGDALALPFADNSFDLVSCGLFLHHLDAGQVATFARETLRVAHTAVLISDLVRSRLHLALAHISLPLYRSPITWHDALASIRAAYTPDEIRPMLANCGARRVEIERHYLYRMGIILWK
jgi:ubiquinone/menaquinone biosynthesis C-methylase UbiE